jgi:hypothetical protein
MIKSDEITFLMLMQIQCRSVGNPDGDMTRVIIKENAHLIHPKRAYAMLNKWVGKGWYDYGTVIDGGWLTEAGMKASYQKEWENQQK